MMSRPLESSLVGPLEKFHSSSSKYITISVLGVVLLDGDVYRRMDETSQVDDTVEELNARCRVVLMGEIEHCFLNSIDSVHVDAWQPLQKFKDLTDMRAESY